MRTFVLLGVAASLSACGSTLPTSEAVARTASHTTEADPALASADEATPRPTPRATIHAPALRADELIAAAGVATFLEDHALRIAEIDMGAMERWFVRKPSAVFLYAERPLETAVETSVRGSCQRLPVWDDVVLNGLSVVLSRRGSERAVLEVGQERVAVTEQGFEDRRWRTNGIRGLPMGVVAWDDAHIAFAEGAEIQELACVNTVRSVLCAADADPWVGPRGHCIDRALVVRPWRPAWVPHVGPVHPAYPDVYPSLPEGACEVECEPSACDEALRTSQLPRVPLYTDDDPVLALFRAQSACRAYATSRGPQTPDTATW